MTRNSIPKRRLNVHICEQPKTSSSNLPKLPPNAKLYSRWRRSFQKLLLVTVRHPFTRFFLRSQAAIAFEKRRHGRSTHWWVIHPCSGLRFCWDVLMTVNFLYFFVAAPYIISFYRITKSSETDYWIILYPACIVCIVDIFFNFITGFSSPDSQEIFLDPIFIARNYVQGYFIIDLISSIPYTWIYRERFLLPGPNSNSPLLILELLPILKVFRMPTLRYYIREINATYGVSHAKEMTFWLLVLTLLIFHWSSCASYAFPYILMHILGTSMESSGAYAIQTELYKKPDSIIYLTNLHIGVSNLVGFSFDELQSFSTIDKTIRCILLLLGKGYMIYLIVIILQLVESSAEPDLKYQEIIHQVMEYVRDKKLSKRLRNKLVSYYEYRFQGSYFKENVISSTLSNHLNREITIHISRGLLETSTILHDLSRTELTNLMTVFKFVIYLEDDIIYKANTEGDCMYFIVSGTVALITFLGKEICHLQDGDYFGEAALFFTDQRRHESVIALEACELLRFDRRDFKRLIATTSNLSNRLETAAKERLEKIKELNSSPITEVSMNIETV